MMPPLPRETDQIRTLARTFLARFFDNDLTGGSTDLRHSFLWLLGAIALPGMWLPHTLMGRWARIAMFRGPEALQVESAPEKVVILGVSMVMIAGLTAIVWHSLLIDRRDVIVIGSFPVRHRTVLGGKLGALIGFFAIITVAMNTLASFFFGMYMGMHGGPLAGLWQMVAHFVASAAAGLFMYLAVISAQGLLLGIAGPRQFGRLAPVLQLVLIAAALLLVALLPLTAPPCRVRSTDCRRARCPACSGCHRSGSSGCTSRSSALSNPVLHQLAGRALLALVAVAALTAVSYPLAYRRVVHAALVGAAVTARRGPVRRLVGAAPALMARQHIVQAGLQFVFSTVGRTTLHRLVIAIALGTGDRVRRAGRVGQPRHHDGRAHAGAVVGVDAVDVLPARLSSSRRRPSRRARGRVALRDGGRRDVALVSRRRQTLLLGGRRPAAGPLLRGGILGQLELVDRLASRPALLRRRRRCSSNCSSRE